MAIQGTPSAPLATIASLAQHDGQTVTLRGWLYNLRSSGKLLFPTFRDGTGTIQGIVPKAAVPEQVFQTLKEHGHRPAMSWMSSRSMWSPRSARKNRSR